MTKEDFELILYEGLQALSHSAFPKYCANCGRRYASPEAFIEDSESLKHHSGLKQSLDDDDRPVVELFRNCVCGSTLMDVFENRRDDSPVGTRRREIFEKMINRLVQKGMEIEDARLELRRVLRGEDSPRLKALGLNLKPRS